MSTQPLQDSSSEIARQLHDEVTWMASMPVIVAREATSGAITPAVSRLLVLVPDLDVDEVAFAECVWSLAQPRALPVFYVGRADEPEHESLVRRRLATLAAITRDDRLQVETHYLSTHDWPEAIRISSRAGDLVVTPPAQILSPKARRLGFTARSAPARLSVITLPGTLFETRVEDRGRRLRRFIFWPVSLMIIMSFFWLQVLIDQATDDLLQIILLSISVLIENGALVLWYSLAS